MKGTKNGVKEGLNFILFVNNVCVYTLIWKASINIGKSQAISV